MQEWEVELATAPRVTLLEAETVPRTGDVGKKCRTVAWIGLATFLGAFFAVFFINLTMRRRVVANGLS